MAQAAATHTKVLNYIDGSWVEPKSAEWRDVVNPATGETIAQTPLTAQDEVGAAVEAASAAYRRWRRTPPEDRIQPLFKMKQLLEDHLDELARIITWKTAKQWRKPRPNFAAPSRTWKWPAAFPR